MYGAVALDRGRSRTGFLAATYTQFGEYDAAVEQLDQLLSIPSLVSSPLLRVDPLWAPLRSNPRFQALLAKYDTPRR